MKFWCIVLFSIQLAVSQNPYPQDYFMSPLEIPIILSGTFGELRNNHFHSGLDIKTQQTEGLKVVAAADGFVSRIKIAHYGYGKALYITHPNGYTTVYAHLQKLAPKLEAYLKKEQYQREIFEIELLPKSDELLVSQGEVIAFSGNTGSSGGPHLHYEIRDNLERPINPMLFGLIPRDTKAPIIQNIYVYPKDNYSFINGRNQRKELRIIPKANNTYEVEPFTAFGTIGFGITTHDLLDLAANRNGVSNITTHLNGVKNFEIDFKKFSFDETLHLNRLIDYEYLKAKGSFIQKLFIEPNNPLSLYNNVVDNGYVKVTDSTHSIFKIIVSDFAGNTAHVNISVDGEKQSLPKQTGSFETNPDLRYVHANQIATLEDQHVTVNIPANTFYDDIDLKFKVSGDTLKLHKDTVPLQKNIGIFYDVSGYQDVDKNKLFIAKLVGYKKYATYLPTMKVNNTLSAYTKTLGEFTIKYDTKAPQVAPVNWQNGQWLSNYRYLKLKITDNLSGISSYRATINGKFILMEYEYKTNTITHDFNDDVVTDTRNELKLIVVDNVGNSTTFEATFFRK